MHKRGWGSKPKLGQHFLADRSVCEEIIAAAEIGGDDHVVEIGPGQGALTGLLNSATSRLTLIEPDHELARSLSRQYPAASLLQEKAEEVDISSLEGPVIVVSNLPYYASVFIYKHLTLHRPNITRMVLMFQKEVAQRIAATPGGRHYGSLSVMGAWHWDIEELFIVKPGAFRPPPKVDSAVLRFTPLAPHSANIDEARLFELVRHAFAHKRRTLRNNLKGIYTPESIERGEVAAGLTHTSRAEEIGLETFIALSNHLERL